MRTRVKVSGLLSPGEVRAAVGAGADALGFGGEAHTESSPWETVTACPPGVSPVLHTSREDPQAIANQAREAGAAAVQLPPGLDPVVLVSLRRLAPGLKLIQVVRMADEAAADLARGYARLVDAVLLELVRPVVSVLDLGSAVEPHTPDWRTCRKVVQASAAPVWLAGGLTQGSVGEAVEQVNPFGVDVGTGVRTAGRLDARKLSGFFHSVRVAKIG